MSSKQVSFTTEIVTETHLIQWEITNFRKMPIWPVLYDTLFIEVETGSSANLEAKWIIGFTSVDDPNNLTYDGRPNHQLYCKPVKLPGNMQKVGATLTINPDHPLRECIKVGQCLTLNDQMVTGCRDLYSYASLDSEGTLVLDIELTVIMPQSIKSRPTPCLPD